MLASKRTGRTSPGLPRRESIGFVEQARSGSLGAGTGAGPKHCDMLELLTLPAATVSGRTSLPTQTT
jgi:hypothetical protein